MKISEVIDIIEDFAPPVYAESYDNVGLLVGDKNMKLKGILLTLDVIESTIDEAIEKNLNFIISHHPLIFSGLKSLTGRNATERIVMRAIKNDIAIYAAHTNLDSVTGGVSFRMGELLGLKNIHILSPIKDNLIKLVIYTPFDYSFTIRQALNECKAGHIGAYNNCTFSTAGSGRYCATEGANPFRGEIGVLHTEGEDKIETIISKNNLSTTLAAIKKVHPYEEPAYDIFQLLNIDNRIGLGIVGDLEKDTSMVEFLNNIKKVFGLTFLKHSPIALNNIRRVALCGGAGSSLIKEAIHSKADVYLTGDIKYHDYFIPENKMTLVDIGHFESEQFTLDIIYDVLIKKITTFAICKTTLNCNPVNYL